ncbi:lysozyme inhibitor LprI family protein [Zhouia sp. PK063]|uniref:lysozyme inhibitor LprI family protein n=1 Tax=Zhouia sp. PK063 TaxID=3373602 RepID=UPI0037B3E007
MNKIIIVLFLGITFQVFSQTQEEMNREAYGHYHKVDDELNAVYAQILTSYKKDTLFIKNLKNAQRIWIKFRDAQLAMKYPDYPDNRYGSIEPICRVSYLSELTQERINTLKEWLDGIEEGETCSGSVKIKNTPSDK